MPPVAKKSSGVGDRLRKMGVNTVRKNTPVWEGPESAGEQGGITFSLLCRYLTCKERFRLLTVERLKTAEKFNPRMEYGNMWHVCEEALAAKRPWEKDLQVYAAKLAREHRLDQEAVEKWYGVAKVQFPIYVKYWADHPDVTARTPLLQEQSFRVPYRLGSGRVVYLRGKFDAVDLIEENGEPGIYLQENKTKSEIDDGELKRQLGFDLQTMLYLVALGTPTKTWHSGAGRDIPGWKYGTPIRGVRYNVIRRPLSGGKGSIVRHKAKGSKPEETWADYWERLRVIIEEAPGEYFARFKAEVAPADVKKFERECLQPILEGLCDWWDWVKGGDDPFRAGNRLHYRSPYGVFNPLLEGYATDLDNYLDTGNIVGLQKVETLFRELV